MNQYEKLGRGTRGDSKLGRSDPGRKLIKAKVN